MIDNRAIADAHIGDLAERGLKSCQELRAKLVLDAVPGVIGIDIAADILVEQDRIADPVSIFAEAADRDVYIEADILVDNTERNRIGRAVLIADDVLGIEIVDPLIMRRYAAVGKTCLELLKARRKTRAEAAGEHAGLCGGVIGVGAGLRADIHDRALIHNDHALALVYNDRRAVRDDILAAASVKKAGFTGVMLALPYKNVRVHLRAVKILFPLISKYRCQ